MGIGKNKGNNEAEEARKAEEKRQADIRAGTARINGIFDGSTTGTGTVGANAAYNPSGTYYNADGSVWKPTASNPTPPATVRQQPRPTGRDGDVFGRGQTAAQPVTAPAAKTAEQQFREALSGGKLFSGTSTSAGFNDDFFNNRKQAYIDYATPQLEDQYGDAQKQLTYALARGGNLDSSIRGEQLSKLQKLYDTNKQKVADDALSYETQARGSVEDARANLISTLNATGDVQGATSAALARSQALSQQPAYNPLSQLFVDFTSGLGTQAALERAEAMGGSPSRYSTGLFGNSGRVVNS